MRSGCLLSAHREKRPQEQGKGREHESSVPEACLSMPAVYTLVGPFQAWGCMCTCTCLAGINTWQLCGMYFTFGEAASVLMRQSGDSEGW
jgi:hypothetical protein